MAGETKEEALEKWWERWREEDFTWEGLTRKRLKGWVVSDGVLREKASGRAYGLSRDVELPRQNSQPARRATLQDYWRAEVETGRLRSDVEMGDELIAGLSGDFYHALHLPLAFGDGTSTGKAGWSLAKLLELIAPRFAVSKPTEWSGEAPSRHIAGADHDAQMQGGVFPNLVSVGDTMLGQGVCARFDIAFMALGCAFEGACFKGDARFSGAMFLGLASFEGATFECVARFDAADFLGDVWFGDCEFNGLSQFGGAQFAAEAGFESASFLDGALWRGASFSGWARFVGAKFGGEADFSTANFAAEASFTGAEFDGMTRFYEARFCSAADFHGAKFFRSMTFHAAEFRARVSFERIQWPTLALGWHGAFERVLFAGVASFEGAPPQGFAAFDGAVFERGLRMDDVAEVELGRRYETELDAAKSLPDASRRLRQLERGCRVLKQTFERAADKSREQLFYRFELRARRAQSALPLGEALFSDLYSVASDYGASMVRPFFSLAILLFAFAATFHVVACVRGLGSENSIADAWQAFDFSLTNVFKPLSALSSEAAVRGSLAEKLLTQAGYGWTTGVRALAILQSILAIVLAFLFALAVRRRFQIS